MEYAPLCWINASPSILGVLDNIQKRALEVIGVDEATAHQALSIPSLTHRHQVAAASVLYKMHFAKLCPKDFNEMLPLPLETKRVTIGPVYSSTPDHAVSIPAARTHQLDRSFIHTASTVWNSLPDHVVGTISYMGLKSCKNRVHRFLFNFIT